MMSNYKCPSCKSENIQKFAIIHLTGTSDSSLGGEGIGISRRGIGIGLGAGSGKSQSGLAALTSPPKQRSAIGMAGMVFAIPSILICFLTTNEIIVFLTFLICSVPAYFVGKNISKSNKEEMKKYERSFLCLRCGATFEFKKQDPISNNIHHPETQNSFEIYKDFKEHKILYIGTAIATVITLIIIAIPARKESRVNQLKTTSISNQADIKKSVLNGVYKIGSNYIIKLKDGSFKNPSADHGKVEFETFATGNLNNDNIENAAVILTDLPGGSGTFSYLFVLANYGGNFRQKGEPILLGDRIKINSIIINDGIIIIDMIHHGPDDALCCPTMRKVVRYKLNGNQLNSLD